MTGSPERESGGDDDTGAERSAKQHWWSWSRPVQIIVGAGAVAGALTAVIGLLPDPDPQDSAQLEVLSVVRMPLSEFVDRAPALTPQSARRPGAPVGAELAVFVSPGAQNLQQRTLTTLTVSPTTSPTPTPTTSTTTSTPTPTTTTDAPLLQTDRKYVMHSLLSAVQQDALSVQVRGTGCLTPDACTPQEVKNLVAFSTITTPVNANGQPVSANDAATKIVRLLGNARASKGDTLGVLLTTNVRTVGLRNQDLVLSWSVFQDGGKKPLPKSWRGTTMGSRIRSTTDNDSSVAYVWVPLPKERGSYFVQLSLGVDGHPLTSAMSPKFG